ncbi:chain length determinant protein EpsF [Duganella sp. FT135W]|uniref:Chain length determinant protein EpsF n=1 Tax=Duganella flavida TaxID=2692175 RepID=A0A6L8KP36_9BURK|nr:chain length determinant protein EpsF [Duganella flavida]MYM26311.1 chain length determinant protein EpsF [Duganella flavida]
MNLNQLLLVLRARYKIILITMALTTVTTLVVSLMLPKSYKATASVLLNYRGIDPLTGMNMPGQLLPGYMATQIDIITSKNVSLRVIDQLKLAQSPAVIQQFNEAQNGKGSVRDWLADLLVKKLDVLPARESSVVEITFKGSDPQFVAAVANAYADEYQKLSIQLKVDPLKKASAYFNDQLKGLRDSVEVAQGRLSKYQQDNGIVSVDNRLDVESNRLNDLSAQLVTAQVMSTEAASRERLATGQAGESPDVSNNSLVQNLRAQLALSEAKLAELGQRLDHNHPQYQASKAEVERMRADLNAQVKSTSNSVGNTASIMRQREGEIRAALQAQKAKVLELNRTRDEMNVLLKDVENAQRAFDATAQRFSQTRIEGQSEQSDIALLNPATAPAEPSSPKVVLNTMLSVVLGIALGVALGMVAEMLDRRLRSESDLSEALGIPVFGTIAWNAPKPTPFGLKKLFLPRRLRLN